MVVVSESSQTILSDQINSLLIREYYFVSVNLSNMKLLLLLNWIKREFVTKKLIDV